MQVTDTYVLFDSFEFDKAQLRQRVSTADKIRVFEAENETVRHSRRLTPEQKQDSIDNNLERIKKLQELSKKFSAVQEIKGDGNYYYRAIIRGYIE